MKEQLRIMREHIDYTKDHRYKSHKTKNTDY